jgi:hypothetical protein
MNALPVGLHDHLDLFAPAVARCVLDEVAQRAPQKFRIGARDDGGAGLKVGANACALLGCKRDDVDFLVHRRLDGAGVDAAGDQNFIDELVKLMDVARKFIAHLRRGGWSKDSRRSCEGERAVNAVRAMRWRARCGWTASIPQCD